MGKIAALIFLVLAVILVACGGESEPVEETALPETLATLEPATNTPVPPTNTAVVVKEPITCDSENNPCVEVTFDGENCVVEEPTDNRAGWYTFVFTNESDGVAKIEAGKLGEGRTLEGLAEDTARRPSGHHPSWITPVGLWEKPLASGDSAKLRGRLKPGEYGVLCFRVPPYAVYGDGFVVEDSPDNEISATPEPTVTPWPTPQISIEVSWDGSECVVTGPSEVPVGYHEFIWSDQTDRSYAFAVRYLHEGYSYQDLLDVQGEPGKFFSRPSWVEEVESIDRWDEAVGAELHTYHLEHEGNYDIHFWNSEFLWVCGGLTAVEEPTE
jgi:hypothetical protein